MRRCASWFPTALTFGAVSLAFIGANQAADAALSSNSLHVLVVVLAVYWLATFIALRGVGVFAKLSKWGGVVGTIIPAIVLIAFGLPGKSGVGGGLVAVARAAPFAMCHYDSRMPRRFEVDGDAEGHEYAAGRDVDDDERSRDAERS